MKKIYTSMLLLVAIRLSCLSQPSPVAYFPFTVNGSDSSGNNHDGILHGGIISDGHLQLGDNITDYFSVPSSTVQGLGDFAISFNFSIHQLHTLGASPTNEIFAGERSPNIDAFNLSYQKDVNAFVLAINANSYQFVYPDLVEDAGYCLVVQRQGSTLSLFLNGLEVGNSVNGTSSLIDIDSLGFVWGQEEDCVGGCFASNQCFNGILDNIRIFNESLSSADIEQLCNPCSVKINLPFTIDATDSSGNGFNGTPMGNATIQNGLLHTGDNSLDYLAIPEAAVNGMTDFDVSMAVKFDVIQNSESSPSNNILAGERNNSQENFNISYNKSVGAWRNTIAGNYYDFPFNAEAGVWYCIDWRRVDNVTEFYVDGAQAGNSLTCVTDPIQVDVGGLLIGQEEDCTGGCFAQNQSMAGYLTSFKISSCPEDLQCDAPVGIPSAPQSSVSVYPNPFSDKIFVDGCSGNDYKFCLLNFLGEKIIESTVNSSGIISLNETMMIAGIYFYEVKKNGIIILRGELVHE